MTALRDQSSNPSSPLFCPHVYQRETLQKYLQKASKPVHFLKSTTLVLPHHLELQYMAFYRVHCCLDLSPISCLFSFPVFYFEYLAEVKPGRAWSFLN